MKMSYVVIMHISDSWQQTEAAVFHPEVLHNGLFKILGGHHVVWACEVQIPRGAHRIKEGANAPPPPLNDTLSCIKYHFSLT